MDICPRKPQYLDGQLDFSISIQIQTRKKKTCLYGRSVYIVCTYFNEDSDCNVHVVCTARTQLIRFVLLFLPLELAPTQPPTS